MIEPVLYSWVTVSEHAVGAALVDWESQPILSWAQWLAGVIWSNGTSLTCRNCYCLSRTREQWMLPCVSWVESSGDLSEFVRCTLGLSVISSAYCWVLKADFTTDSLSVCRNPLSWPAVFTGIFRWARTYWSYCKTNLLLLIITVTKIPVGLIRQTHRHHWPHRHHSELLRRFSESDITFHCYRSTC